jgi:NADH-quinone oxidoreductase subunit J
MSASTIVFYILSLMVIGGALLSVTSRKIFRSAVYLLFCMIGIAGMYFFFNYEFLGAVQVVVYVGGIIVLIIFSIFLTAESGSEMKKPLFARASFAALATLCACAFTLLFMNEQVFSSSAAEVIEPSVKNIGRQMLSTDQHGYILPFETVSILLLAAMIGCIVIAIKIKPDKS